MMIIIFIHEIIFIAQVVLVNVDLTNSMRQGLLRRSFESLEEILESDCVGQIGLDGGIMNSEGK